MPASAAEIAAAERADPDTIPHDVDRVRGRALVVVRSPQRALQRGVGGHVHDLAAEPEAPELREVRPGRAGKRGLPAQDPVELDGVADRLVDLEGHLLAAQDQVRRVA